MAKQKEVKTNAMPVSYTHLMAKTGMKIEDFDIIEANEAFAVQSVAVGKEPVSYTHLRWIMWWDIFPWCTSWSIPRAAVL